MYLNYEKWKSGGEEEKKPAKENRQNQVVREVRNSVQGRPLLQVQTSPMYCIVVKINC